MKTDLTTPGTLKQSQARTAPPMKPLNEASSKPGVAPMVPAVKPAGPDYAVQLSGQMPTPPMPSLLSAPTLSALEAPKEVPKEVPKELPEVKKLMENKRGTLDRPAVIFIKGLDVFSSPLKSESGYAGVGRMAESVEGSRIYGWDQKQEIIDEVLKIRKDKPVILVGHSFGGDTAVDIANELDTLENSFRSVELLVTIDAVGFDNDIIPQNVKRHLNVFGENNFFLNDGPHVARRNELTEVTNLLSPLDHTELDDDKEIQFEVVSLIRKTLGDIG